MLVALDAPYVDTRAADLSLALGGPEHPALHVRELTLPAGCGCGCACSAPPTR